MEQRVIALEEGLDPYKKALEGAGFSTIDLKGRADTMSWQNADMIMLSGINENFLGIQDAETKVPVISVQGLTADEAVRIARDRLH